MTDRESDIKPEDQARLAQIFDDWFRNGELHRLLANGAEDFEADRAPVLKLVDAAGDAQFLLAAAKASPDHVYRFWGLADLGKECPEIGVIALSFLVNFRNPLNMHLCRDETFSSREKRLSAWLEDARKKTRGA